MGSLNDVSTGKPIILLWGPGKVGKTVLASQFGNCHFISTEDGLASVKSLRQKYKLDFDLKQYRIDESKTTDPEFAELCGKAFGNLSGWEKVKKMTEVLSYKLTENDTLVLDHLTRIADFLQKKIEKSSGHRPLQLQDWNTFVMEMKELFEFLKAASCKCTVILLGHEEYMKDEATGALQRLILIPTKMRYAVPAIVTDYLYMKTEFRGGGNNRRAIRTLQSVPDPVTNTGSYALIPDIQYPTYAKLRPFFETAYGRKFPEPTWTPPIDE